MDVAATSNKLRRITSMASALALCVIVLGAYVRLADAGLACPDWPGCFGQVMAPSTTAQIQSAQSAFPGASLHPSKAWIEMIHRYAAGTLGLLILALFVVSWRERSPKSGIPVLPAVILGLVIAQALLGMVTVTAQLKPVIVTLHLVGGMTTLGLLVWLISKQHQWRPRQGLASGSANKTLAAVGLAILFVQISLGGWTSSNAAGLVCSDFPTCQGNWVPAMDFANGFDLQRTAPGTSQNVAVSALTAIHWTHRTGGLLTVIFLSLLFVTTFRFPATRSLATGMLGLVVTQAVLGASNVIFGTPVPLALLHNIVAAALVITVVAITFRVWSATKPGRTS